jgi:hypothetical protein
MLVATSPYEVIAASIFFWRAKNGFRGGGAHFREGCGILTESAGWCRAAGFQETRIGTKKGVGWLPALL